MGNPDLIGHLNSQKVLFLNHLEEDVGNDLRLLIKEGIIDTKPENLNIDGVILKDTYAVSPNDNFCFEILFNDYITYSVINESYAEICKDEKFVGHLFRIYSKSNFLEYTSKTTINYLENELNQYQIICEDQYKLTV